MAGMIQDGVIRADLPALQAADAGVFIKYQLGRRFAGFRVLAPGAGQRAAFKENRCADARAVMQRKPLDIEYGSAGC